MKLHTIFGHTMYGVSIRESRCLFQNMLPDMVPPDQKPDIKGETTKESKTEKSEKPMKEADDRVKQLAEFVLIASQLHKNPPNFNEQFTKAIKIIKDLEIKQSTKPTISPEQERQELLLERDRLQYLMRNIDSFPNNTDFARLRELTRQVNEIEEKLRKQSEKNSEKKDVLQPATEARRVAWERLMNDARLLNAQISRIGLLPVGHPDQNLLPQIRIELLRVEQMLKQLNTQSK